MDSDLLSLLQNDETYKQFIEKDFDAKAYANSVIQSRAISDSLSKLADGITLLDKELHSQVVCHHEDLLQQATGIETLEGVLQMMQSRINSLMASVQRIQQQIVEPYNKIESRTAQLRRLQAACDVLRRVIRIMYLTKRLQEQLKGGAREVTKAAQSLSELDYLVQGADLSEIQVISQDIKMIAEARKDVENQAKQMLSQGMEGQNQTQVATALQVFYNLGCLSTTVDGLVERLRDGLKTSLNEALDASTLSHSQNSGGGPGRASMPMPGNSALWRAALWTRMEKLMDVIFSACAQVYHLLKVLAKKRDPVTHVCFMEELIKEGNTSVITFWDSATSILSEEFADAAQTSTFLKQAFEGEYPKLLRLYNDLWVRLQQFHTNTAVNQQEPAYGLFRKTEDSETSAEDMLKQSLSPFQTAYISRSLSRLFDSINLVFPSGARNPPQREELTSIAKTIGSELSVASVDVGLTITVAKNVSKTLQMYTAKCETLLPSGKEAGQVQDHVTSGQLRGIATVNSLYQLHLAVTKILSGIKSLPDVAVVSIRSGLQGMVALMNAALDPLIDAFVGELDQLLYRMHSEDFSSTSLAKHTSSSDTPCSGYIKQVEDFIQGIQRRHLSMFECTDLVLERLEPVACRVLEIFVCHASLLRPIGEGGKLKLAADMAQIEFAVGPLCRKVSDLGKPYKLLRSFRPLLFQTSPKIVDNPALGESLPYSVVLHYLFSRAPSELKSPHEVAGWTLSFYSNWLDDHKSEGERLALIRL
ncbi:conserved oligomeric Golgi complex subunit 5 isoform X2 [Nematostella vectensis]|uniref:conserved oligomeric Golgi complex subunit 5 isoform X2 n=1 Tax=Nematostella vectensis TaxID=45351 RepID=UPI0020776637|nr:conserved oligomeric Golgi complex subunit 5 isoform X2 [Nematostella vectensis]